MTTQLQERITATSTTAQLSTDVNTLQQMVLTLFGQIDDLQGQLYYLKRQLFGQRSEKLDPHQRLLFENLYQDVQAKLDRQWEQVQTPSAPKAKSRPNAHHNGRRPLPSSLPRETVVIEPEPEEKVCGQCHNDKTQIGEDVTEKLEYIPALFYVKRYVRPKYGCKTCGNNIAIGELPPMVIDKGVPGESVLAHIIASKYADHLSLNRLEGIFKRHGVEITVSNMCDWVGVSADLLAPLVDRMHELIRQSPVIHTDDTRIPIQSKGRKGSTYNGYLWVYLDKRGNVVFDFTPTRSREGPNLFLGKDYTPAKCMRMLIALFRVSKATEARCNAHARRKFEYALDSDPV